MIQRDRGLGRPRTADDDLRENNYHDANGRYVLSGGLKPWHARIVDYMILNPHAKIVDIAQSFGVTSVWVGKLIKTDAFREYYNRRMIDHQDLIGTTIVAKMQSVAVKALDKMADKIDKEALTFGQVKDAVDTTLKGLGYTSNGAGMNVNVKPGGEVTVAIGSDVVAAARQKLAARMRENTEQLTTNPDAYTRVTSSLELKASDVEDAVIISSEDS